MIIEKIDERTVAPGMDVSPLLNFKAGKPTALSIFDPAKDSRFVVSMKPIALGELEALLYERWVKQRRDLVDKHFQLGKLIGMPVADSGSYVWWETLQDPALFFGIPEVGLQDDQGQFLERTQVDPDIEVMNDPKSTAEGRDLQLERATTELMKEN